MNDQGTQLMDTISGKAVGNYGSSVSLGGPPVTSDDGSTAMFPGGATSTAKEAVVSPATQIQPANAMSIELWFKESKSQSATVHLAAYGLNTTSHPYELMLGNNDNQVGFGIFPKTDHWGLDWAPQIIQPGVQYHIVGTYDGKKALLYVNGQVAASDPASGGLSYANTGFSIGAANQAGDASLVGPVGDVAVYGYALSAAQVENHYATGAALPMAPETPKTAQGFVDSIGINTHWTQQPYFAPGNPNQEQTVANLLVASGIHHIRDGMVQALIPVVQKLGTHGIRATYTTSLDTTDQQIETWWNQNGVAQSFEAYEGPNEPNLNYPNGWHGQAWDVATRAFMQRLSQDVHNTPGLSAYPIIGPSCPETPALGNLSSYANYGNTHSYFSPYNPGTPGWGQQNQFGIYGSLSYDLNEALAVTPGEPTMATETGYDSTPTGGANGFIDNVTAAKYIERTYFVTYNAGVPRTFLYELLDQNTSGQPFTRHGLVDLSLNPKPAYYAIQAIIAELADSGPSFKPTALTYQLTGNLANVQHTLLEKSDGSYYLALWIEAPSWSSSHGPYSLAPQTVNVVTQKPMRSATIMYLDDTGHAKFQNVSGMPKTEGTVQVSDRITILKMSP